MTGKAGESSHQQQGVKSSSSSFSSYPNKLLKNNIESDKDDDKGWHVGKLDFKKQHMIDNDDDDDSRRRRDFTNNTDADDYVVVVDPKKR
jgi:hypothetical protein